MKTHLKTERSKEHQNYLGFLDQKNGRCQVFEIKQGNQIEIVRVLKLLLNQDRHKRICIIWDNARWHKTKYIRTKLAKGKSLEKVHLIALPPYAPEVNPIEHVWRFAKDNIANRQNIEFEEIKHQFDNLISQTLFNYKI